MRVVLRTSNIEIFRYTFVCHYSWDVLAKFDENLSNPYTFHICSKWLYSSQNQDVSSQRFANNSCHARRLSRLLKPQTNRITGSPEINDGSRFLGKSNPLQTRVFFFTSIAQWNVEEDDKITSKVVKGKGKTRGKDGKTGKGAEEQDNESTYCFQNYDSK